MNSLKIQEYIREKNLCAVLEIECTNQFIVKIDAFFADLFSELTIYTKDDKHDLIYMKEDKLIMMQDLKNGFLICRFRAFWSVLKESFSLEYDEIQVFISYMVEEAFKMGSLTPYQTVPAYDGMVEEAFKKGELNKIQ